MRSAAWIGCSRRKPGRHGRPVAYGTQAAGEFVASHEMDSLASGVLNDTTHKKLQIVPETNVTDGTPGPLRIVDVHLE
jgi:hypothetical protein